MLFFPSKSLRVTHPSQKDMYTLPSQLYEFAVLSTFFQDKGSVF